MHDPEEMIMSRNSAWIHYGRLQRRLGIGVLDWTARVEYLFLLGRILYGGFFVLGGLNHFMHLGMMSGFVASKGVPAERSPSSFLVC